MKQNLNQLFETIAAERVNLASDGNPQNENIKKELDMNILQKKIIFSTT